MNFSIASFGNPHVAGKNPDGNEVCAQKKKKNCSPHPTLNYLRIKAVSTYLRYSKRENKNDEQASSVFSISCYSQLASC